VFLERDILSKDGLNVENDLKGWHCPRGSAHWTDHSPVQMAFLLSAGSNARGQLSNGSTDDSHQFQKCIFQGYPSRTLPPQTCNVIHITAGANHTLALLEMCNTDGRRHLELWGCGDGSSGQLGDPYRQSIRSGESPAIFRPIDLSLGQEGLGGYHPKVISASWDTTYVALASEEKGDVLISMGADDFGDLGVGGLDKTKGTKPFHIIDFSHLIVEDLSKVKRMTIQSVDAGQHHVLARVQILLSDGHCKTYVLGWGLSRHGQLGKIPLKSERQPTYLPKPTVIVSDDGGDPIISTALGSQHTVLLHASGRVSSLGSNRKGQLQGIADAQSVIQLACTWNGTYLLIRDDNGAVGAHATGSHAHGQLGRKLEGPAIMPSLAPIDWPIPSISAKITEMACGTEHVLVLVCDESKRTSEVWGWGWNEHGNLGTGRTEDVLIPRRIWRTELEDEGHKATGIWAGCGTSWIYSVKK